MRAEIPFEFSVGTTALPAGLYTFTLNPGKAWLEVIPAKGQGVHAQIITRLGGPTAFRDASFVFDKSPRGRTLSEVWIPGVDGILVHSTPKGHGHEVVIGSSGMTQNLSGSAAYEKTCQRCHGPDGKGDDKADKFFKTTIPRLSEAYVQGKSDAELREVITQGRRGMDPVRIDESGFRHLLSAHSVDTVIAYVRTLRK